MEHIVNAMTLSADWYRAQADDPYAAHYVYYYPSDGPVAGDVIVAQDCPAGYSLADTRRLYPDMTRTQVEFRIRDIARRLPILPTEEV